MNKIGKFGFETRPLTKTETKYMGKTPKLYYWNTVKQSLDYKLMEHHQYTSN
jgi:hypothetical protein